MACSIAVPFWPVSTDCLSWSLDNQIAVAGRDSIAILTPRLKNFGPHRTRWDITLVKVNLFTAADDVVKLPVSSANFSIGEESSTFAPTSVSWSWPGIARHRGCALAVLTSNHVLSVWAPEGRSSVPSSWHRVILINRIIKDYLEREDKKNDQHEDNRWRTLEERRVRLRIRAYVWSPPVSEDSHNPKILPYNGWGDQFLAVGMEGGDVYLLRVLSPYNTASSEWRARVTDTFNVRDHVQETMSSRMTTDVHETSDRALSATTKFMANHLAWSPWRQGAQSKLSNLAYVSTGRLFTAEICTGHDNESSEAQLTRRSIDQWLINNRCDLYGPVRFVPYAEAPSVIVFGTNAVFHVQLDGSHEQHHLDDRWDDITGLALTNDGGSNPRMHIVSHLSSATSPTTRLTLPLKANVSESLKFPPSWQQAIVKWKAMFSDENDLDDNVQERTWGIASSPLGDFIATCGTLHPSDSLSYIIGSDQSCSINITWEGEKEDQRFVEDLSALTMNHNISASPMLFSLQRQIECSARWKASMPLTRDMVVKQIEHHCKVQQEYDGTVTQQRSTGSAGNVIEYLRSKLLLSAEMQAIRETQLADISLGDQSSKQDVVQFVITQLTKEVLCLPTCDIPTNTLTTKIRQVYDLILSKLDPSHAVGSMEPSAPDWVEECNICRQPVTFESFRWARCTRGHPFARCGLTFFSIQEPGATKVCQVCGRHFLREKGVAKAKTQSTKATALNADTSVSASGGLLSQSESFQSDGEQKSSLLDVLFAAFEICVYCGGKFTD